MKPLTTLKGLFTNDNKTQLIGMLSILIVIWSILYIIPSFFVSLFDTILGNLILILIVILVGFKNYVQGIIVGVVLLVIYRFSHFKEGFTWSQVSTDKFVLLQNTINPHVIFDINRVKEQASQEELDYFLTNGKWPWSQQVQELYSQAIMKNPFIRTSPKDSINQARTIYNQAVILEMLSWQTKEGQFLQKGVSISDGLIEDLPSGFGNYGYSSGLISPRNNVIKCGLDVSGNYVLQQTKYTGKGGIKTEQTEETTPVDYNDLTKLIPGFSFINGSCNPCVALDQPPNYSCPFNLDVSGNRYGVSNIWQYLWGINTDPLQSNINESNINESNINDSNININEFPILSELKNELNNL
jgi:hypothetical protein